VPVGRGRSRQGLPLVESNHADDIGIVACSAEGAALCYRTICMEGAHLFGAHGDPEVSMHTHSLAEYVKCIYGGDWQGVSELMLSSADKLAKIGVGFLICPDNTMHQALPYIELQSPLRWLHIAEVVADQAIECGSAARPDRNSLARQERGLSRKAYSSRLEYVCPKTAEHEEIHRIMDELVYGVLRPEAIASFQRVIGRMKEEGCDAVVLGCTEIPLIMNDSNSPLPTLHSTRLLALAALRRAVQNAAAPAETTLSCSCGATQYLLAESLRSDYHLLLLRNAIRIPGRISGSHQAKVSGYR
jgi:aspartate racemase